MGFPLLYAYSARARRAPAQCRAAQQRGLGVLATSNRRSGMRRLSMSVLAVVLTAGLSIAYAGAASASSSAIASNRIVTAPRQSLHQAVDNANPRPTTPLRPPSHPHTPL